MKKPPEKQVRRMARWLCKAHDKYTHGTHEHGALVAYDAGSFAAPYWNELARTALNRADNAEGGLGLLDEGGRK